MLIVFEVNFKLPIIRLLLIFGRGEELHDFIFGEQGTAQDPHDLRLFQIRHSVGLMMTLR